MTMTFCESNNYLSNFFSLVNRMGKVLNIRTLLELNDDSLSLQISPRELSLL